MRFDAEDDDFTGRLERWLRSLDDTIISDISAVLGISPGYYPTTLAACWLKEMQRRGISEVLGQGTGQGVFALPVCHPSDYEWRFTARSKRELLTRATDGLADGAMVVHLGTPSTYMEGVLQAGRFRHVLIERNAAVIASLPDATSEWHEVVRVDLNTEDAPAREAQAAILDPPWYPSDTLIFLRAAAGTTAPGARILLCQPTEATRPGVTEEREQLLAALPRFGFTLAAVEPSSVRYEMPHFELISLKSAAPTLEIPSDWRSGDLLILERSGAVEPVSLTPFPEFPFTERTFGPVRLKLRKTVGPDLAELVPGDVLDTVSRRDPIRSQIGIWTSGNRVFGLAHVEAIGNLIDSCHTDLMNAAFTLERTLQCAEQSGVPADVARRLFGVLLVELQEHLLYAKVSSS